MPRPRGTPTLSQHDQTDGQPGEAREMPTCRWYLARMALRAPGCRTAQINRWRTWRRSTQLLATRGGRRGALTIRPPGDHLGHLCSLSCDFGLPGVQIPAHRKELPVGTKQEHCSVFSDHCGPVSLGAPDQKKEAREGVIILREQLTPIIRKSSEKRTQAGGEAL